ALVATVSTGPPEPVKIPEALAGTPIPLRAAPKATVPAALIDGATNPVTTPWGVIENPLKLTPGAGGLMVVVAIGVVVRPSPTKIPSKPAGLLAGSSAVKTTFPALFSDGIWVKELKRCTPPTRAVSAMSVNV